MIVVASTTVATSTATITISTTSSSSTAISVPTAATAVSSASVSSSASASSTTSATVLTTATATTTSAAITTAAATSPSTAKAGASKISTPVNFHFPQCFEYSSSSIEVFAELHQFLCFIRVHVKPRSSSFKITLDFAHVTFKTQITLSISSTHSCQFRNSEHDIPWTDRSSPRIGHFNRNQPQLSRQHTSTLSTTTPPRNSCQTSCNYVFSTLVGF
mmetsp:Transcript_53452/g.79436  ORF Transcript_53452/g.79436 Transcript_53452/m.79436 type:complete len:217 (-) Transcript_53452:2152-2802(-)